MLPSALHAGPKKSSEFDIDILLGSARCSSKMAAVTNGGGLSGVFFFKRSDLKVDSMHVVCYVMAA